MTALSDGQRRKLQNLIDRTARAQRDYYRAQEALNEWTRATYGSEAGDVDADEIIDAVFGGCGLATGLSAEEYDQAMRRAGAQ